MRAAARTNYRLVRVPLARVPDDVTLTDLERSVRLGEPGSRHRRDLVVALIASLVDGHDLTPIVIVVERGEVGVLDGRHRVAAAREAGVATIDAYEYVGELRGIAFSDS
jgi:ParB/Sulfiredoxin domain